MANELHTFTGNEVIATELPELLNQNFNYVRENSLKSVNGVEKDENNNVDVTFLTSQVIPTNSDLNNFRESGEYTREVDTVVVANSPTEKPFFLTVLASENLVKQVVTEIDRKDPMTFTRTLSGANWSPWVEGGKVKSIMGLKANDEGDVDLTPLDYPTRYELGIWKSAEEVSVGDVRFLEGRENVGYVLECVANGITGEEQPTVVVDELANYSSVGRIGQVRVIFNLAEKDVDEVMAMGITYSRLTYPELWDWAGKRAGLIISEEEWQAKFAETNGKFVPYYSSGDGSSTFRTPLLGAYLKGAETASDVGKWLDAGLPNIEGVASAYDNGTNLADCLNGAFYAKYYQNTDVKAGGYTQWATGKWRKEAFDASLSNPIYGNSDTVTPETMTGVWVIKAVGVVIDSGETDIAQVLQSVEEIQNRVSVVEDSTVGISDYIVESYRNGTEWYDVYKSGKVRQGGKCSIGNISSITLLIEMANSDYIVRSFPSDDVGSDKLSSGRNYCVQPNSQTTTKFGCSQGYGNGSYAEFWDAGNYWEVEGQGA